MEFGGLFGVLVLIADIFAIVRVFQSRAEDLHKIIWIVVIALLPLIGLVIWYVAGPGDKRLKV